MMKLVAGASPLGVSRRTPFRIAIVLASVVVAVVGSVLLVTRDSAEEVTTRGVTATLQVASHPGWIVAGQDALWLALSRDPQQPVGEKPLLRLDLASGLVEQNASVGGEASYLVRTGSRLIASVRHAGQDEFGGRTLVALDWQSGRVLVRRGFDGPVDHVVPSGRYLWALEVQPGTLLRLDPVTLAPTAPPLHLSPDRALDLTVGGGYIWATAADAGEVLRIDPATRAVMHVHVGGFPIGIAVAGESVWYADQESNEVARLNIGTLRPSGSAIHVDGKPTWLAVAGGTLFVASTDNGIVSRIDLRSGMTIGLPIRIAEPAEDGVAFGMASSRDSVWVSSFAENTVSRISAAQPSAATRTIVSSGIDASEGAAGTLPRGGRVVATIPVSPGGGAFTAGEGAVWAFSDADSMLMRIDPKTNSVSARIAIAGPGEDAAVGHGAVWISQPAQNKLVRIDPSTNEVTASIPVGPKPAGVAVSPDAVWVANIGGPSVSRIDPATNRVVATIRVGPPSACCAEHVSLAAGKDDVWVAVPNADTIVRIDPATNTATNVIRVPYSPGAFVVADARAVWNASGGYGEDLARIDARTRRLTTTVKGEPHPVGLGLYDGSLWVAALRASSVDRVDPDTGRLTARLPVGGLPVRLVIGFGSVWVTDDQGRVLRIEPES